MKYRYLYQDKTNKNCEGEIVARDRADAYTKLRKSGIRPYRVIGDDPFDWRPLVLWGAIFTAIIAVVVAAVVLMFYRQEAAKPLIVLTPEEAAEFRDQAERAVFRAPESCRYNVWRGVNVRLKERGLDPLPKPEGLHEEDAFAQPGF